PPIFRGEERGNMATTKQPGHFTEHGTRKFQCNGPVAWTGAFRAAAGKDQVLGDAVRAGQEQAPGAGEGEGAQGAQAQAARARRGGGEGVSALIGLATGKAGLVTVTETGELYLAIPLADWERVVASATAY